MTRNHVVTGVLMGAVLCLIVWNVAGAGPGPAAAVTPEVVGSISVSGSSAIRVQPDRAVVVLGVQTFAETPAQSQALNTQRMTHVRAAIRAVGVADKDVTTANFTIWPEYEDWGRHDLIRGYVTSNNIAVTVRDVSRVEELLVRSLEAGATSVEGIEFSVNNLRELRDDARALAVEAAMEKAADMAAAAGISIGQVTAIGEQSWNYYGGLSRNWTANQNVVQDPFGEGAILLEDGSISLGQITVRAEVSVSVQLRSASPP